jgi:hypothetical protein
MRIIPMQFGNSAGQFWRLQHPLPLINNVTDS